MLSLRINAKKLHFLQQSLLQNTSIRRQYKITSSCGARFSFLFERVFSLQMNIFQNISHLSECLKTDTGLSGTIHSISCYL